VNIVGIIPARMASSRFPGKPLAKINGIPMIGHVYYRGKMATILNEIYVATCDQVIVDYIKSIGGEAIMTTDTHERATDRTAEAVVKIEKQKGKQIDIVAMLQGDEPMITPKMIESAIDPVIKNYKINISNLMGKIIDSNEFVNDDVVKVVIDKEGYALYFSRESIPSRAKYTGQITMWKQLGLIVFRKKALLGYSRLEPTHLEKIESVDMNRLIENGKEIKMVSTNFETIGVDTELDLQEAKARLKKDPLVNEYLL
jgi:3-deoxy-manno-octulosonate cytidylyltransferase (CMP-KDO synthetase)